MKINQLVSDCFGFLFKNRIHYIPTALRQEVGTHRPEIIEDKSALFVILPRAMYQEWVKNYPIENKNDLLAILQSEGPTDCFSFYSIGQVTNRSRTVTCWQIPKYLKNIYPNALVFIPESVILSQCLPAGTAAEFLIENSRLFVLNGSGATRSAVASEFINTLDIFCCSVGERSVSHITKKIDALDVKLMLHKVSLKVMLSFFIPLKTIISKTPIKEFILYLFSLFFVYQIVEFGYLKTLHFLSASKIDLTSEQVESLILKNKNNVDSELSLAALSSVVDKKKSVSKAWPLIHFLKSNGVVLVNVEISHGSIVIRGTSKSATQTLETIKEFDGVKSASFDNAVRRQGDQEQFAIKLNFMDASHAFQE